MFSKCGKLAVLRTYNVEICYRNKVINCLPDAREKRMSVVVDHDCTPFLRLIPLSQVDQYLGLAGQIQNVAGFEFFES